MADNIPEVAQVPQTVVEQPAVSRWGWLKQVAGKFTRFSSSVEVNEIIDSKPVKNPVPQIPQDSGLETLVTDLEKEGKGIVADRIRSLYEDMLSYLSRNKERMNPEEVNKLREGLGNGDRQIISILAGLLKREYREQITTGQLTINNKIKPNNLPRTERRKELRRIAERDMVGPGFKFRLADSLAREMQPAPVQTVIAQAEKILAEKQRITPPPPLPPQK